MSVKQLASLKKMGEQIKLLKIRYSITVTRWFTRKRSDNEHHNIDIRDKARAELLNMPIVEHNINPAVMYEKCAN